MSTTTSPLFTPVTIATAPEASYVSKDFNIFERLKFQSRVNAFNDTNLQVPSGALSVTADGTNATFATASGFGKTTGTQPNRQMQLSARFLF